MATDAESAAKKARALMDRAAHASTPEEEARSCAMLAIKMLKEAGLRFATEGELAELEELREFAAKLKEAQADAAKASYPYPFGPFGRRNNASPASPFDPFVGARRRQKNRERRAEAAGFTVLKSVYRGFCRACRREYKAGEEIAWRRGGGATHYDCRAYWAELDRATARK